MKKEDFLEIETIDDLIAYSKEMGKSHANLFHYTNKNAVLGIINKEEFWVRNTLCQNDLVESIDCIKNSNLHYFTASFSHDSKENIAQWYMYGDACKGYRICLQFDKLENFDEMCKRYYKS